jgi:hypothetical protein
MVVLIFSLVFLIFLVWGYKNIIKRCDCETTLLCNMRSKIRVAVINDNSLLLCSCLDRGYDGGKMDILLESVVGKNETVENALNRLIKTYDKSGGMDVRFSIKHKSCNARKCWDVYFFIAFVDDRNSICLDSSCDWVNMDVIEKTLTDGNYSREFVGEFSHIQFLLDVWRNIPRNLSAN